MENSEMTLEAALLSSSDEDEPQPKSQTFHRSSGQNSTRSGSEQEPIADPLLSLQNTKIEKQEALRESEILDSLDLGKDSDQEEEKETAAALKAAESDEDDERYKVDEDELEKILESDDDEDQEEGMSPSSQTQKQSPEQKAGKVLQEKKRDEIQLIEDIELNFRKLVSSRVIEETNAIVNDKSFLEYKRLRSQTLPRVASLLHDEKHTTRGGVPKCICYFDKFIFVGNSQGVIRIFDEKQREYTSMGTEKKETRNNAVQSVDLSNDRQYLVAGYKKGQVMLWSMESYKLLDICEAHKGVQIVLVKFYSLNDRICVISADMAGYVYILEFYKAFVTFSHDFQCLLKMDSTCWAVQPLAPNPDYPHKQIDNTVLVAAASVEQLKIVVIHPKAKVLRAVNIYELQGQSALPYLDWGYGVTPQNRENTLPLLAFAWGNILQLGILTTVKEASERALEFDGYFIADFDIQSVFWMSESVVMIISNKQVRLLYSGFLHPGRYTKETFQNYKSQIQGDNRIAQSRLNLSKVTESAVLQEAQQGVGQLYMNYLSDDSSGKASYHQAVSRYANKFIVLAKETTTAFRLMAWQHQLEELFDQKKVKEGMSYILRIYIGQCKGFAGIPHCNRERRQRVLRQKMDEFLRDVMLVFTPIIIMESKRKDRIKTKKSSRKLLNASTTPMEESQGLITPGNPDEEEELERQRSAEQQIEQEEEQRLEIMMQSLGNIDPIKASIEFCVATRSWEYLFDDLQARYLELGLDLEPFILQKRINEPVLSSNTVNLLLQFYEKEEPARFEKLVYFLNLATSDISAVLKFFLDHHCYSGIYFLLFSGQEVVCEEPTSFTPVVRDTQGSPKKIFRITKKKKNSIKDFRFKYLDFQDLIKLMFGRYTECTSGLQELAEKKEAKEDQDLSAQEEKKGEDAHQEEKADNFSNQRRGSLIQRETLRQQVGYKILWILGLLLRGVKLVDKNEIKDQHLVHRHILSLFQWMLEEQGELFMNAMILHDAHKFFQIIALAYLNGGVVDFFREKDKPGQQDSILSKLCIKFEEIALLTMKQSPSTFYAYMVFLITIAGRTKFPVHKRDVQMACVKIFSSEEAVADREVQSNLLFVIKHYFYSHSDQKERLNTEDIQTLVEASQNSKFYLVRILCNELVGNIFEGLRLYIEEVARDLQEGVFEWYDKIISELHFGLPEKEETFNQFKHTFMSSLSHFINLSPSKTADIVENWFGESHHFVLTTIENDTLTQLKYTTDFLKKREVQVKIDTPQNRELLLLHVRLLCMHRPFELMFYITRPYFPFQECLEITQQYARAHEASAYLCVKTRHFAQAIKYYSLLMESYLKEIESETELLGADFLKDFDGELQTQKFDKILVQAISVCQQHYRSMDEPEMLWFLLMDSLFSFKMGGGKRRKKLSKDFEEFVKRRIIMLLESMSNHIPLPRILKELTLKNSDADYKEFKPLFRRMLHSYFCHETILERANSLMRFDKLASISTLMNKRVKGVCLLSEKERKKPPPPPPKKKSSRKFKHAITTPQNSDLSEEEAMIAPIQHKPNAPAKVAPNLFYNFKEWKLNDSSRPLTLGGFKAGGQKQISPVKKERKMSIVIEDSHEHYKAKHQTRLDNFESRIINL